MGLFDLPAPLLTWASGQLSGILPPAALAALGAAVAAILSLELYRFLSPQQRIADLRREAVLTQRKLASHDGELAEAWPLIGRMLSFSLKRVALVLPATVIGVYPVIALLLWTGNTYGYRFPTAGEQVAVKAAPAAEATWEPGEPPNVEVQARSGGPIVNIALAMPVPSLYQRRWWNLFAGNPAGYLPAGLAVDHVTIDLPRRRLLPAGPAWASGWEAVFLLTLTLVALVYKHARRIE
jgi:hypothetical protein